MINLNDALIVVGSMIFGIIVGVVLVRYGIRVGNRITIAAQNNEPVDMKPMPKILQETTE